MEYRTLRNGVRLPMEGFGTYKSTTGEAKDVLKLAIEAGYRYFDTAAFYQNEEELGEALISSGLSREEVFLTSKVWKTSLGYEGTKESFQKSLDALKTDYLDLYLIHWPKAAPDDEGWERKVQETWKAMTELYHAGRIRAIGVSNFLPHHLKVLEGEEVQPMVDQIEFHPGYPQLYTVSYCKDHGIQVQAWSPIGRGRMFGHPVLQELSAKYHKSLAQICLRFALQMGVSVIPKASSLDRMKENQAIFDFEISTDDMERILGMEQCGWSGEHPDRERVPIGK